MKLSKLFESLYQKQFVAIVHTKEHFLVCTNRYKKNKLIQSDSKSFEASDAIGLEEYVHMLNEESPYTYIALLNRATIQGALCNCSQENLHEHVGNLAVKTVCIDNKWLLYSSKEELESQMKIHKSYGVDFVFSPFHLIREFFIDKMQDKKILFILLQDESVSVTVFQNTFLIYAKQVDLNESQSFDEESDTNQISLDFDIEIEGEHEGIKLDDIDALDDLDNLDELDDLSDIEDLDALEELDEFSEDEVEVVENNTAKEPSSSTEIDNFDSEYIKYSVIKESIETYYRDEKYDNAFIEDICIADATSSSEDLKRYLEEELFLQVIVRQVDIAQEIARLSYKESTYV